MTVEEDTNEKERRKELAIRGALHQRVRDALVQMNGFVCDPIYCTVLCSTVLVKMGPLSRNTVKMESFLICCHRSQGYCNLLHSVIEGVTKCDCSSRVHGGANMMSRAIQMECIHCLLHTSLTTAYSVLITC